MEESILYIKNGTIIDPKGNCVYKADLQIEEGRISRIIHKKEEYFKAQALDEAGAENDPVIKGQDEGANADVKVIDAQGLMIAPGLADTHVHFRDPGFTYKEDIHTDRKSVV